MIAKHPNPCKHKDQDEFHGKDFRVMNPVHDVNTGKLIGARCTVCSPKKVRGVRRGGVFPLSELVMK